MFKEPPRETTIFLALGTNLSDREVNLAKAKEELGQHVALVQCSSIYETPPWGVLDQPAFLNQVIKGQTTLAPFDLLVFLKDIENKMGRVKTVRYGARLIDIDILIYGDQILITPDLVIPHPRMLERAFVLVPLAEIQPELVIPGERRTVREMLQSVDTTGIRKV